MISLAYILKNESLYIERSIASARSAAGEIVVLDTGSEDDTVEICEGLGAKVFRCEWEDDFSKARNLLKSHCSGDWILMLDADEHLEGENVALLPEAVSVALENGIVAYQMPRKNHYPLHDSDSPYFMAPFFPDFQTRLFANVDDIYFSGRVHEGVLQSIEMSDIGGVGRVSTTIHHHMFRGDKDFYEKSKEEYYDKLSSMDNES
jgi:glycosyltransferase involved in cell wall biosynthesis